MESSTKSSRTVVIVLGLATTLGLAAMLTHGRVGAAGNSIFGAFSDPDGVIQAATANNSLGPKNTFFDPGLGTNGQACVTCHQPSYGFDIHVGTIQDAFTATNGMDPLFRVNDTAGPSGRRCDNAPGPAQSLQVNTESGRHPRKGDSCHCRLHR